MKLKVRELEVFDGSRDAKMLENFLWDVDQYLGNSIGATNEQKINTTTMYLFEIAKIWWRTRVEGALAGRPIKEVKNWEQFKDALKE